jgi:UDP-2-acetamido-3-amino-2,3-dideoxy-glucuronate N-acetyltransferase
MHDRSSLASPLVSASALLGPGCEVGFAASIGDLVRVGSSTLIGDGARVGHGVVIGDHCSIGPNVVLIGEASGRSAELRDRVQVGAGVTIDAGVVIASDAVVRPGSVVTRAVPPRAIVAGNPAAIIGYSNVEIGCHSGVPITPPVARRVELTPVRGVTLHRMSVIPDMRGSLSVGEFAREIPFTPLRYFLVFDVPSREVRGEHAHRECHQFLICVRGSCSVVVDDGERRLEVLLDAPEKGLYLPPMIWGIQYKYSSDALLLVFASHHYDAGDYIRDYAQYLESVASRD